MVFFSGWGLVLIPIALVGAVIGGVLGGVTDAQIPSPLAAGCFFIGGCVAGALSWWLGSKTHASLMFIPAKVWAVLLPVLLAIVGMVNSGSATS